MEFVRPRKSSLSLDMAPLIDIVFQLLIFFMLSSSFLAPSFKLNLPKAVTQDTREQERIVISVEKNGSIYVNSKEVELESLKFELTPRLEKDPKKSVHFRGDREIPYSRFVEITDLARQAGAKQINIIHETERD